mmetsp:Transcript_1755/g.3894  ORF Transcript_1755/g.3894 Transcript_1755/m.3894 type:complete len:1532 (+) Transcript_1755:163-4758(+)
MGCGSSKQPDHVVTSEYGSPIRGRHSPKGAPVAGTGGAAPAAKSRSVPATTTTTATASKSTTTIAKEGPPPQAVQQQQQSAPKKLLSMTAKRSSLRDDERNRAVEEVQTAMQDLRPYQMKPLTKQDKVLVMQGWNKALAFSTAFSEALLIYWRLICCPTIETSDESGGPSSESKHAKDPMSLVEKNQDPLFYCLQDRMGDAETLLMGVLDGAIRSLCPANQVVQREAYRPMQEDAIVERTKGEFSLECQSLDDHFALFARLGVKPYYWVRFVIAVHWTMSTHAPYAQEDDLENLELGAINSALGRVVALTVAIPAIQTYKGLVTLYQAPIVHKIQDIWNRFSEVGRADFGEIFYRKLLTEHPQLLDFFSKTDMDTLAIHLSMALDMVIRNVHAMGAMNTMFRSALENLAEVHRRMNVPTYSYALVGATILECFQPVFDKEEEDTKDSDDPAIASELRAALVKVYGEIMSLVYYPMLKQERMVATAREFYEHVKEVLEWSDNQLESRFSQIEEEIQATGSYIQTTEELETGARLAWRNSAKCVGRIAWNTLKIRDCRHIKDPDKMFKEVRQHLLEATAGTNIQSVMTVFKPQAATEVFGTRFWSSQFVRYAAYKNMLTGKIVGDPANLEITEYLISNNLWTPPEKISRFDVLPLVLKLPGKKKPIIHELPKDCIFEVDLEHPDRPELSALGLRWSTVPAISNFKMNLGGIVYQNMPFNGWFVSTEIVRNLMERYDVGPEIAAAIGLDTEKNAMWRQMVSCEVEHMVLHSFQKHKFTIVDPMTVGRQFCTHVQREREQFGRECPGQWSWIGGLLGPTNPTWHLELRDFLVKPQYEYASEGMLLHGIGSGENDDLVSAVSAATSDTMSMFSLNDVAPELPNVLILYGSQTGNAEAAARRLKRDLRLIKPAMMTLNDAKGLGIVEKRKFTHVIAVCSTFGDGHAPGNASEFFETELPDFSNEGKQFAVLGLGSTVYPKFCQAAEKLEKMFRSSGLESIATLAKADEAAGADGTIEDWIHLVKAIILPPNIEMLVGSSLDESNAARPVNKLHWLTGKEATNFASPAPSGGSPCILNEEILESHETRSIRKITFKGPAPYESGDHLSVKPANSDAMVRRFLQCFMVELRSTPLEESTSDKELIDHISTQPFDLQVDESGTTMPADVFFQTPTTLGYLLKHMLNLSLSSKDAIDLVELVKQLLDERMESATGLDKDTVSGSSDIQTLLGASKGILDSDSSARTQAIDDFIATYPTIVDFLETFKDCLLEPFFDDTPILSMAELLCILTRLQPRYYSISSSNKVSPDEITITVGVLRVETSKGVTIDGVCSNYLASLKEGVDGAVVAVHKSSFRLPKDPQAPIMMVGAGTGLSPMMGFLDEKALAKKNGAAGGIIHLFFGCRTIQDFIYKEKIEEYEKGGLLVLHHALSRSSGPKTYVQNKIKEMGKEAADLLLRKDTHYYVCGDARMAKECYESCIDVLRKHAVMSRVTAARHLKQMEAQGRWQTDVWGIVSDYENAKKQVMESKRKAAKLWMQHFDS